MARIIALLGTLETKSAEIAELARLLEERAFEVATVDVSLRAGGTILTGDEKIRRMAEMVEIATGRILAIDPAAVVAVGGATGSDIAMRAMRPLSLSLPKFMITTLPFDPRGAVADNAITLVPTLCDIQGMNVVLRRVFTQTAAMVAGAAEVAVPPENNRPMVAVSLLGVTQNGGEEVIRLLQAGGCETAAFHSAGYGGAALTRFAESGFLAGSIDLTVNEIVRMHVAGSHVPMPGRFSCAAHLPRVVMPGAMNFLDGGAYDAMPEAYRQRANYRHSNYFTHVKLSPDETTRVASALAEDLNRSTAHCEVIVPMGGFSTEDRPGGAIEDPELRERVAKVFEAEARAYTVTRIPFHINDPETAGEAVQRLLPHINKEG